ncbi:MAG: SCO family protein [Candidatus Neomarinimicrobiota bacterium]|nr:MAG: SCO family protein [Candidatus Neomarinimicrobiota bacterium]
MKGIDVIEHYGERIPLAIPFRDAQGSSLYLEQFFHSGKPVILTLNYFECPMLCTYELNGLGKALQSVEFLPGKEYELVTVSIDPQEGPALARKKQTTYLENYFRDRPQAEWHFLTGDSSSIRPLAQALGYQYYYDENLQQFAHPAVIMVLTDEGVISRYLYGITFNPLDLRLALTEAGRGAIGSTVDRVLLYCYHYDPQANSYVLFAGNLMRMGGYLTVLILVLGLGWLWSKELRKKPLKPGNTSA